LEGCIVTHEGEPAYLTFSKTAYALAAVAPRIMPRTFSANPLAFAWKAAQQTPVP
jgi:hypothetical protein